MARLNKKNVHTILFITLSNLGDIILTTPVLEKLYDEFPEARIDIITGSPGRDIFTLHPAVRDVIIHKRRLSVIKRLPQVIELRRKKYDMVVDLKNSLIPYLIGVKYHSKLSFPGFKNLHSSISRHKKDEHLSRIYGLTENPFSNNRFFVPSTDNEKGYIDEIINSGKDDEGHCLNVVINPGAKSPLKRWDVTKYAKLSDLLVTELACRVFVTGDKNDKEVVGHFLTRVKKPVTDLCCRTSIRALFELIGRVDLIVTNDSAPLHAASASNTPTVAIFGPTDEEKYGPLADRSVVVKPLVACRPCDSPDCDIKRGSGCISDVEVSEVFKAVERVLGNEG